MFIKGEADQVSLHSSFGPPLQCSSIDSSSTLFYGSQTDLASSTFCSATDVSQLEKGPLSTVTPSAYKTKGWLAIAGVMFCEFVGLSCLSLPGAIASLGWAGSILTILANWFICTYTSHVLWKFCLRHPGEIRSVADIARKLSGSNVFVVRATIVAFLCYACSVGAIHTQISAVILNTLTGHSTCTVVFALIGALVSCALSMSRKFSTCGALGLFSACMMATALLLTIVFIRTGNTATSMMHAGDATTTTIFAGSNDFITIFNAILAVSFSFVGQICVPSLIDEMHTPEDFGKALWTVQFSLLAFFSAAGLTIYSLLGSNVPTPVIAALDPIHAKVVFSFTVPADICIGALFCFIAIKFFVNELYSPAQQVTHPRTVQRVWIATTVIFWTAAFLLAQIVPFFDNLVSLMSALFGSYFGFILWSWTSFYAPTTRRTGIVKYSLAALNLGIAGYGVLFLVGGGYSSIMGIVRAYASGSVGSAFSCANNGF